MGYVGLSSLPQSSFLPLAYGTPRPKSAADGGGDPWWNRHLDVSQHGRHSGALSERICCKNSLATQDVVAIASSLPLWNVVKIFFATDPEILFRFLHRLLEGDLGGDRAPGLNAIQRLDLAAKKLTSNLHWYIFFAVSALIFYSAVLPRGTPRQTVIANYDASALVEFDCQQDAPLYT